MCLKQIVPVKSNAETNFSTVTIKPSICFQVTFSLVSQKLKPSSTLIIELEMINFNIILKEVYKFLSNCPGFCEVLGYQPYPSSVNINP